VIVIGIIGRIGAGKSTVAALLADHGARVIDADRIAHEVLLDGEVRDALVERFGVRVLVEPAAGGTPAVNRRVLAGLVFGPSDSHRAALADLEGIVHPRVHRRIEQALAESSAAEQGGGSVTRVVLDRCDLVLVLECPDAIRRGRIAGRFPAEQIAAREAAWNRHPPPVLRPEKTRIVDTSGDPAYTRSQIERIWYEFSRLPPS
jgi:dephospho-CoA kinase